jgi:hypothetical protein
MALQVAAIPFDEGRVRRVVRADTYAPKYLGRRRRNQGIGPGSTPFEFLSLARAHRAALFAQRRLDNVKARHHVVILML